MDKKSLNKYIEKRQNVISDYPKINYNGREYNMDEQNTKTKIIEPLLEVLGWDPMFDMELEYPIKVGSGTKKVDYVLMKDTPAVFIETKAKYKSLKDTDLDQLRSYMKLAGVRWGILTNGKELKICRLKFVHNQNDFEIIKVINIDDIMDSIESLSIISKNNIYNGNSLDIADQIRQQPGRKLNKDEIYEDIKNNTKADFKNNELVFSETKPARSQYVDIINCLFEKGHLTEEDMPIESGKKRYLINSEPIDKENENMHSPKKLDNGYYIESHYGKERLKRIIEDLIDQNIL